MIPVNDRRPTNQAQEVIKNFIQAINEQNISQLVSYLSEDHVFTNSSDKKIMGKELVIRAWMKYFELFPNYNIKVEHIMINETDLGVFGNSSGTYKNLEGDQNRWELPSAWKVKIADGQIKEWQVYTDNMVPYEIIRRNALHNLSSY